MDAHNNEQNVLLQYSLTFTLDEDNYEKYAVREQQATHFDSNAGHCAITISYYSLFVFRPRCQADHARAERKPPLHVTRL